MLKPHHINELLPNLINSIRFEFAFSKLKENEKENENEYESLLVIENSIIDHQISEVEQENATNFILLTNEINWRNPKNRKINFKPTGTAEYLS